MNPHEVLGVDESASEAEIRKAYKKQALKYHPDKVTDPAEKEVNETKFKEITHAYEILTGKAKGGSQYEEFDEEMGFGAEFFQQGFPGESGGMPPPPPPRQRKNEDVVVEIALTIFEMYNGKNVKFQLSKDVVCSNCEGSGWRRRKNGALYDPPLVDCHKCHGKGFTEHSMRTPFGFSTVQRRACETCHAAGKVRSRPGSEKHKCAMCKGRGLVSKQETVLVSVERGASVGDTVRMAKMADQTLDGNEPGDLVFVVKEKDPGARQLPGFERRGNDLYISVDLPLVDALSGFDDFVIAQTYDDRTLTWSMPRGKVVRPGDILKVPGEGWPYREEGGDSTCLFGDLYVTINIEFPPDYWFSERGDLTQLQNILPTSKSHQDEDKRADPKNQERIANYEVVRELPPQPEEPQSNPYAEANARAQDVPPECATQ